MQEDLAVAQHVLGVVEGALPVLHMACGADKVAWLALGAPKVAVVKDQRRDT
jgi:hypothetical protein